MKRLLSLLLLVAGCTATPVASAPTTTTTTTTTETTVVTTSPRIDTPKKLPADPCQLLTAADFDAPLAGTPAPDPAIPRSCVFQEGKTGTDADMFVVVAYLGAFEKPADAVGEMLIEGHSTAISFVSKPGTMQAVHTVAVNATESYLIIVDLPKANSSQVSQIGLGKAQQAFRRLVTP
ncbi:hypothetical protein ACFWNN_34365 [Lentzea sp. NPDC058450]|uniref:hypothetical protein n=1 Tax=Lentzea sp. NPDC058450 TaxID=3346505 RepID=UPI00365B7017